MGGLSNPRQQLSSPTASVILGPKKPDFPSDRICESILRWTVKWNRRVFVRMAPIFSFGSDMRQGSQGEPRMMGVFYGGRRDLAQTLAWPERELVNCLQWCDVRWWDDDGCCCEMDEILGPCCHHHLHHHDAHTYCLVLRFFKGDASLVWPHPDARDHGQDDQSCEYLEASAVRSGPEARIILQIICNAASITPVLRQ